MPRNNHGGQLSGNQISPESPSPAHQKPNPRLLPILLQALIMSLVISLFFIFIGVAAIIFLHLCLAGAAFHRRQNRHRPTSGTAGISNGYSSDFLNSLPKSRFKGLGVGSCCCPICLESVVDGDMCRVLPVCKHVFHLSCVDKWLVKVPACPVCRACVGKRKRDDDGIDWEQLWAVCG